MTDMPNVSPKDCITVGTLRAAVSRVYHALRANGGNIAVVFLDGDRAVNRDVIWTGTSWEFVNQGDLGGHADQYARIETYVNILRNCQVPKGKTQSKTTTFIKRKPKSDRRRFSR